MKYLLSTAALLVASQLAFAQAPAAASMANDCAARAISKDGKPLAGAAKTAFVKKCAGEAGKPAAAPGGCEAKAVSKDGKPLHGAAKAAFIKKCEKDAK
ncbi:MAG: hypothetical protein KKF85_07240 [Gammaproteobacteria bacterium]|nr:hypothetical protein [Rhodocyclaceae bacterium]MBU3907807.1 hypothetical protein [Gammaproteobacteria bacterium]MBU3990860.1 hypothetical protein [Gammaproteobacteria bacterium]MBU4004453.1 hypothetical protein [Gammaproteobacteria bacterium]MBU4019862.1 hypothetical protein [Gammaproteobacteria bacterium]